MKRVIFIVSPILLVVAISCGDSGGSDNTDRPNDNAAGDTGTDLGGASTAQAGNPSTSGKTGGGSSNVGGAPSTEAGASSVAGASNDVGGANGSLGGAGSNLGGAPAGGAAQCPDLFGTYDIKNREGTSCGDLDKNAAQTIAGNDTTCSAHFVSAPAAGKPGINGEVDLDQDGSFTGVTLTLGSDDHSPCEGIYNAQSKMVTVKCGDPGNLCTILLTRK
jgi:hypothetical protein